MDMTAVAIFVCGAGAVLGWVMAWRSRGEAITFSDKATAATATWAVELQRTNAVKAQVVTLQVELDAAQATIASLRKSLQMEQAHTEVMLERLANAGVPIGPDLLDDAVNKLYPNGNGGKTDAVPGGGAGSPAVPGDASAPAVPTEPS